MGLNEIGRLFYSHSRKCGWTVKALAHVVQFYLPDISVWKKVLDQMPPHWNMLLVHFFVF